ncbi:glycosyltransferase family 2 protein [Aquimarina sp. 2201CG14-23]|uniref:glycosyltransferase family 2 protein n=1 Tax=Aquimarina mycalae TaxID=3040073 RepID=UPI00247800F1|nr:glycosyltransferase family 2 protein [Aquimarina sp. 2201CG14-23]MDH7444981.1 glycosyltransferase family 2 protein [Aquimarina sp. 2201CG14-23]
MKVNPLFSIIIPVFNKEDTIYNTLTSVLEQDFNDYEIIVINDGSTDNCENIILGFKDHRIQYISTENNGVSKARNLGIKKANGKLIAFLDADDYWYPNHLEVLSKSFQKFPDAGLYTTSYEKRFNHKSTFTANFNNINAESNIIMIVEDFFESSTIDAIAWTSACAVSKKVFDTIGVFDTSITHGAGEDTDLWIRIALKYNVILATFITATYHLDANNRISNTNTLERSFMDFGKFAEEEETNQSLKKYLDQNRYAISLLYKSAGDYETAKKYKNEIDYKNLNTKQRILLLVPRSILNFLKMIRYKFIVTANFKLSAFE